MTTQQQQAQTHLRTSIQSALESFRADPANRYFDNLEETIADLFEKGVVPRTGDHMGDLRKAYELAARMNPEVSEALIEQRLREQEEAKRKREQEAADKARKASRSISGSRVPGTVVQPRDEGLSGPDDVEADVRRAFKTLSQV